MATKIRITMLAGTYGASSNQPLDYPPSPWRLLHCLLATNTELYPLLIRLAAQPPAYHLPYAQIVERSATAMSRPEALQLGPGAAIYINWPMDLTADEERQLSASLAEQRCLGRPCDTAVWQVVPSMPEPNCRPSMDGILQVLCCNPLDPMVVTSGTPDQLPFQPHWQKYSYTPIRQVAHQCSKVAYEANRALYTVTCHPTLPGSAGIAWTDRLHRALLRRAPGSTLFSGLLCGQPLPEDQRAWYRWYESDGAISLLEVLSHHPFGEAELDALQGLHMLVGHGGLQVQVQLQQLDSLPPSRANRLFTITPMLLYTTPRPGKMHRTPAAQAIQTLLWGMGEQGKLDPQTLSSGVNPEEVCHFHPQLGLIRCRTWKANSANLVASRSDRRAASTCGYHAELEADQPLPLLGVGWGRHFGAGRLVVDPQP